MVFFGRISLELRLCLLSYYNEKLPIEDGYMLLPSGPGLGVSLDEAALDEYRIDR